MNGETDSAPAELENKSQNVRRQEECEKAEQQQKKKKERLVYNCRDFHQTSSSFCHCSA